MSAISTKNKPQSRIPHKKARKQQSRQRQNFFRDVAVPLALLAILLACTAIAIHFVTDPLLHPNLHPRIIRVVSNLMHFHPRVWKAIVFGIPILLVGINILRLVAPFILKYGWRKKARFVPIVLKSDQYLNSSMKQELPFLLPQAWETLKDTLPGLFIHIPDVRGTHWELLEQNDTDRELKLALRYVHDPMAIKPWRLYPRQMICTAKLIGRGTRSQAEFAFSASSAMDYQTVYAIIDQTKASIEKAMQSEKALSVTS